MSTSNNLPAPPGWDWDVQLALHEGQARQMGVADESARECACILASRAFTVLSAFEAASLGQRGYYERLLREVAEMDAMLAPFGLS